MRNPSLQRTIYKWQLMDIRFADPACCSIGRPHKQQGGQSWGVKQKSEVEKSTSDFLWCHQESNRGHKDFQSFALPTELWHRGFACAKVEQSF